MPPNGFDFYLTAERYAVYISTEPVAAFLCDCIFGKWRATNIGKCYAVFRDGLCLVENSLASSVYPLSS